MLKKENEKEREREEEEFPFLKNKELIQQNHVFQNIPSKIPQNFKMSWTMSSFLLAMLAAKLFKIVKVKKQAYNFCELGIKSFSS